jgi:hypothetical protein
MTPTEDPVRQDLLTLKPADFVARWFAERPAFIFGGDQAAHIAWKAALAQALNLSLFDLVIVGSAALGRSLSPSKDFTPFDAESDVDVAVVSDHYFDIAWRWMRTLGAGRYKLPQPTQDWIKEHESHYVYWGTIATDQLLQYLPFGPHWVPKLATIAASEPVGGRELNVRLYRDYSSLEAYLTRSVRKRRAALDSEPEAESDE